MSREKAARRFHSAFKGSYKHIINNRNYKSQGDLDGEGRGQA